MQLHWVSSKTEANLTRTSFDAIFSTAERAGLQTSQFMEILGVTNLKSDLIMEKGHGELNFYSKLSF